MAIVLSLFDLSACGQESPAEAEDAGSNDSGQPEDVAILTVELPEGRFGASYDLPLDASGGEPPYRWTLQAGQLPEGVVLLSEGRLVASAIGQEGLFAMRLRVTDTSGAFDERALALEVARDLELSAAPLPRAYVEYVYDGRIRAIGGRPPYSFELLDGELPKGLSFQSDGRLTGVPIEAAAIRLRVRVIDAAAARAQGEVWLSSFGPIAIVDRTIRDLRICFARRVLELPVTRELQVSSVLLALRLSAADLSRLVLKLVSPAGSEVYLRVSGPEASLIDTVFGADDNSLESLAWLAGEQARGIWRLEIYDPRCPYRVTIEEVALVLSPAEEEQYLLVEGWSASAEAGRPSVRIAGSGLPQDSLTLSLVLWEAGANGVPEAGGGDDERLGPVEPTWSTSLPGTTLDPVTGVLTASQVTGAGTITWWFDGRSGQMPAAVLPPDWVP